MWFGVLTADPGNYEENIEHEVSRVRAHKMSYDFQEKRDHPLWLEVLSGFFSAQRMASLVALAGTMAASVEKEEGTNERPCIRAPPFCPVGQEVTLLD